MHPPNQHAAERQSSELTHNVLCSCGTARKSTSASCTGSTPRHKSEPDGPASRWIAHPEFSTAQDKTRFRMGLEDSKHRESTAGQLSATTRRAGCGCTAVHSGCQGSARTCFRCCPDLACCEELRTEYARPRDRLNRSDSFVRCSTVTIYQSSGVHEDCKGYVQSDTAETL